MTVTFLKPTTDFFVRCLVAADFWQVLQLAALPLRKRFLRSVASSELTR